MFAKKLSRREMAVWCAALALGCVLAGLSGFALDWGRAQLDTGAALCTDTLRLHIKADSDSLQDQTAKLAVRDALGRPPSRKPCTGRHRTCPRWS